MEPRATTAPRLTALLLWEMSLMRGSKAPRPSRESLFSSPKDTQTAGQRMAKRNTDKLSREETERTQKCSKNCLFGGQRLQRMYLFLQMWRLHHTLLQWLPPQVNSKAELLFLGICSLWKWTQTDTRRELDNKNKHFLQINSERQSLSDLVLTQRFAVLPRLVCHSDTQTFLGPFFFPLKVSYRSS